MSGIEIIGLISAIINIVDVASKLYNAFENTSHLPQAFYEVAHRLPLVRNTLRTTQERLQRKDIAGDTYTAIMPTLESCKDRAERLRNILQDMVVEPDASRIERYRLAVRRLGKESKVEELMKGMLEDVQLLAASQVLQAVGEEKVAELMKAIRALSKVPASVPDDPTFTHHGTGDQINNTGSGTQNINKGKGQQYIAHNVSFGESFRRQ